MIVEIVTFDDPRLDVYARLTDVQLRCKLEIEKGIFIAESDKVVKRALAADMEPLSLLMEQKWLSAMQPILDDVARRFPDVPAFVAPQGELRKLTGYELTRGALGAFRRPSLPSVADVCTGARRIAVLEDITNHTNVGAIFRSAAALGIDAVLVTPACYDPLYRRAVRVSMGTVFQIPWTRIGEEQVEDAPQTSTAQTSTAHEDDGRSDSSHEAPVFSPTAVISLAQQMSTPPHSVKASACSRSCSRSRSWAETGIPLLHSLGFKTAALALSENSIPLDDPRLAAEERLALVLGTEGDGLSPTTIARCDYTVRIPMHHNVDSLNVAAASAVAFWELRVQ